MNERKISPEIENKLIPKIEKLVKYFNQFHPHSKEILPHQSMFSDESIDLKALVNGWSFSDFGKALDGLLEVIWSDKWFSLLISDLCLLMAELQVFYFDKLARQGVVDEKVFVTLKNQYIDFLERSLQHMNICFEEIESTDNFTHMRNDKQEFKSVFLYTPNKIFIDKLAVLEIDTRRYFAYNWAFASLSPTLHLISYAQLRWDFEAIRTLMNDSSEFMDGLYSKHIEHYERSKSGKRSAIQILLIITFIFFCIYWYTGNYLGWIGAIFMIIIYFMISSQD